MKPIRTAKGFTLVELLVVVGLIASLLALVVATGRPSEKSSIRRAAQTFAGTLLAVQSNALGNPQGTGVMIAPNSSNSRIATQAYWAVMQPLTIASVSGWPPVDPRQTRAAVTVAADSSLLANAFRIRFQAASGDVISPWYSYDSGTASFRDSTGQTQKNTIWPKGNSSLKAALALYPALGASALAMPKQVAIDMKYSGVGENPSASHGYGCFESLGTVVIAFDEVGRLSEVMRKVQESRTSVDQPIVVGETVYVLFAARSAVEQNTSLASDSSIWVAINPLSGRTTVAENVPQSATDATALRAARLKAREGSALK